MTKSERRRIFVSYAREDAVGLALRLQKDLTEAGFDVWLDTKRIQGGESWTEAIESAIDSAHVVLAVMTQGSYISSICRAEQLRGLRKGKTVIPLRAQKKPDIPLHLEVANYRDFAAPGSYSKQLQLLIKDLPMGKGAVALRPQFTTTHVTAPPLPRNYLERPEELASLREAVLAEEPGPGVALTALAGMGGIGKTVLAQALCLDPAVQHAFPDGIAWTTVGREPAYNLVTRMQEVRRALGEEPAENESELHCINRYRTLLQEKAALVVVDDVWRSVDIEPFLAESPRSRLLFTTRDGEIASATGARSHTAELLSQEQSRRLLARWAQCDPAALPAEAEAVVGECGRLPLALSMVGAMLCGKPAAYWGHVLRLLKQADLEKIRAQFPGYPHTDMLRAVQVSVDALEDVARKRYMALAVLLEDMVIAPAVQQTLWNVDQTAALETSERFVALSLAQRDGAVDGAAGGIRLHDLQLDYVSAQWKDREALGLIRGALRLSSHVIEKEPGQFASQLVGRLLPHRDVPAIQQFIEDVTAGAPRPWLRLQHPALHHPGTSLLRTLEGHAVGVLGVALTPDGGLAISASRDSTLKVWDLASGRALCTLEGHSDGVASVAVTPDGQRAVSASYDNTLKVWDLASGRELRTLEGHSDDVTGVAVTPDGLRAVSASRDKSLKVWDLASGNELLTLEGHSNWVLGVAVTPDGQRAVSASDDHTLKVWELASGKELRTLEGHSTGVWGVAVTPDGQRAVSASSDHTLRVWDLASGQTLHTLEGHSDNVNGVVVTPDGKRAVSVSRDRTMRVWDLASGLKLRSLEGHSDWVLSVAVTPDGQCAISASDDKTLKVWDLSRRRELRTQEGHSAGVTGVVVTPDGLRAVSASRDSTLKVWDLASGQELGTLGGHSSFVTHVAVTPDGQRVVSASGDRTLKVWNLASGEELLTLKGHSAPVLGVAVTRDGQLAVSASDDRTLRVWDLASGGDLRTLNGHSFTVHGVAMTPDGLRAVSASGDKTLKVWDLASGRALQTLKGHSQWLLDVAVTPDGKWAVSASRDNTLKIWDLADGRELQTLQGHSDRVNCVALTPDGLRAVSAASDNTLKVWDLASGLLIASFHCDAYALCCAFVDNRRIVAGDMAGRIYFLALEEGDGKR